MIMIEEKTNKKVLDSRSSRFSWRGRTSAAAGGIEVACVWRNGKQQQREQDACAHRCDGGECGGVREREEAKAGGKVEERDSRAAVGIRLDARIERRRWRRRER